MKYNERIIKHNIDVPKLVPNGKINLTKIHYDKSVISHHPKSFEYYMIHGIVIDDIRYVVKEFFVRDNSVLAVVTPDENEYYEVVISNANSDEIDKLKKLIDDLAKSKANQDIDLNLNDRKLTVGDKSVTLPTDLQQLSLRGNKLSISGGNSVTLPEYDDISVKSRIEDLENRVDKDNQELSIVYDKLSIKNGNTVTLPKFNQNLNLSGRTLSISGGNSVTIPSDKQTISKNGNKIVLSNGGGEVDIPTATPYNDADIKRRLGVLEAKPDNDKQTLSLDGNKLKLTNGGEVSLDKFDTPVLRITKDDIREPALFEAKTTIPLNSIANKEGIKPGDIVQDIISYRSGGAEFNYWKVTAIEGNNAKLLYLYQDIANGYNDGELRGKIYALENKPAPEKQRLSLSGNTLSLTDGGSVTLPQGTAYNDTDVKRRLTALEGKADNDNQTLSFDNNTRRLSISNGNNVTIPNDKQTISKNGNKIVLSNGGGEVDIPTATPYDDSGILRRLDTLEGIKYKDKEEVIYPYPNGETLRILSGQRTGKNKYNTYTYKYTSSNKVLSEPFIENVISFDFNVQEKNSITGEVVNKPGTDFTITKVSRQFEELYNEEIYSITPNTSLRVKLNTIWKSEDNKFTIELGMTLIYKEIDGDFVREYTHELTNNEIDSKEQAYISIQVDGVEKGYCKITISEVSVGMSNFGYRVYKQSGGNTYTRLEKINV